MAGREILPFGAHACLLGESPLWHPHEQCLYAVDIPGREVLRFRADGGVLDRWPQPAEPGCIALVEGGGLLVARRDGLWQLDGHGGGTLLAGPPHDPARVRFNDGKVDPSGVFWVGSISDAREPEAALYRFDGRSRGWSTLAQGLTTVNGLAWTADGRRMHWSDTKAHCIYAADVDSATGLPGPTRVFAQFSPRVPGQPYAGRPDGAAMDTQGAYWVAMFEGGCLLRLSAGGELLERVVLPVSCPTMVAFGGEDLQTLFVTTSRERRPADELAREPLAGRVLQLRVDVPGLPATLTQA